MATLDLGTANGLMRTIFLPKIIDTVTKSNPLFLMMRARSETFAGGETFSQPIMFGEKVEGEGGSFGEDDTAFHSEPGEDAAAPNWNWVAYSQPIIVRMIELAKFANTDAAAVNLLQIRSQSAAMKMADRFGGHLYAQVGHNPKDILSVPDAFDDTIIYGGIDRAGAGNDFWKAQHVYAGTAGTATAITLRKVHDAIEAATQGTIRPDIGITSHAMFNRLWDLQMAKVRYADTDRLEYGGFTGIRIDGVPIFWDSHADDGGLDGSSHTLERIRFFNMDYLHWTTHQDHNFTLRDLEHLDANSPVMLGHIFWFGQFYCDNPRYQSELLDCLSTA